MVETNETKKQMKGHQIKKFYQRGDNPKDSEFSPRKEGVIATTENTPNGPSTIQVFQ